MSFQNPLALLWFLPLAGVVVALYLLKMRRRDIRVPASFLWPAQTEEIRANSLFQRLRFSWLLVLQLLALALLCLCLARPQFRQPGLTGTVTVLVIDASASMNATDVKPSRLANAIAQAEAAVRNARAGDRIAVVEAGAQPRVVSALSNDPPRILRALQAVQPTDTEGSVGEALRLAAAIVGQTEGARIVLLSDGAFERVPNFSAGRATVLYQPIGELDDNVSVSALGTADTPQGRQLYVSLKNHCAKSMEGTLTLRADGRVIDSKTVRLGPNKTWAQTGTAPAGARVFEAQLNLPDQLASDNYAATLADPGASLRVLLVTKGDIFLERALALDPRVTLDRATAVPAEEVAGAAGESTYDVVVFEGVPEVAVKARGVLNFASPGPASPVTDLGPATKPRFASAEEAPLLRGVNLRGVFIDRSLRVKPKEGVDVLAESSAGPLVLRSAANGQRRIFVAFEPLQSDFPLQVGFPIFIANALDDLAGERAKGDLVIKAGSPFRIGDATTADLKTPEGNRLSLKSDTDALLVREATRIGRYELTTGSQKRAIYAYLRSDRESDIASETSLSLGSGEVVAVAAPARFADFWRPLVLLGLLVLGFEWWLFARKS